MSLPHGSEFLPALLVARERTGHLFVGLDYDGTLTPLVMRPEAAHLPPGVRTTLERLTARPDTTVAILSGRALADVRTRVAVQGAFYAGNHGLEVIGPGVQSLHPGAIAARPALQAAAAALRQELAGIPGAIVEDKGSSLSVHYRGVARAARAAVRDVALRRGQLTPGCRCSEGKLVVEIRPDVDWDKGAALSFIRAALPHGNDGPALFIGDDRTDEDAFRVMGRAGYGVIVAPVPPAGTAARGWLRSPDEVLDLLSRLAGPEAA